MRGRRWPRRSRLRPADRCPQVWMLRVAPQRSSGRSRATGRVSPHVRLLVPPTIEVVPRPRAVDTAGSRMAKPAFAGYGQSAQADFAREGAGDFQSRGDHADVDGILASIRYDRALPCWCKIILRRASCDGRVASGNRSIRSPTQLIQAGQMGGLVGRSDDV